MNKTQFLAFLVAKFGKWFLNVSFDRTTIYFTATAAGVTIYGVLTLKQSGEATYQYFQQGVKHTLSTNGIIPATFDLWVTALLPTPANTIYQAYEDIKTVPGLMWNRESD